MKARILVFLLSLWALGAQAQVSLTASAGTATGTYTNLTNAFLAISQGTHRGDILMTLNGSLNEGLLTVELPGITSSANYNRIRIQVSGPTTITGTGNPLIRFSGADSVEIDGSLNGRNALRIESSSTSSGAVGLSLVDDCFGIRVRHVDFVNTTPVQRGFAIRLLPQGNNTVKRVSIENCRFERHATGIDFGQGTLPENLSDVQIRKCRFDDVVLGVNIAFRPQRVLVDSNVFVPRTVSTVAESWTIRLSGGSDIRIARNIFHRYGNNHRSGSFYGRSAHLFVNGFASNTVVVENNMFLCGWSTPTEGQYYGILLEGTDTTKILKVYHNSFFMDGLNSSAQSGTRVYSALIFNSSNTSVGGLKCEARNNLFVNLRTSTRANLQHTILNFARPRNYIGDNNLFCLSRRTNSLSTFGATLDNIRQATNNETNSVYDTVVYVSPLDSNLRLAPSQFGRSALAGAPGLVSVDIDGVARNNPPYKGAHEGIGLPTSLASAQSEKAAVRLYPNPARGQVWLEARSFTVFDALGRPVDVPAQEIEPGRWQLDIQALPVGLYWVRQEEGRQARLVVE